MAADTENRTRVRAFWPLTASCVLALVGCGGPKSTPELIELTKSKDGADRTRAIRELGERGGEAELVVPALVWAMKDEDAFVRRDAARALGNIGPAASTAVAALQSAIRDKNQHVREVAVEALKKVAPDLPQPTKKR